jgi:hypothetical protein
MKPINYSSLLLVIALGVAGCVPAGSTTIPVQTDTPIPSATLPSPTSTSTFAPTETSTVTPPATLEPKLAEETIRDLLQEPVDCEAPCFWGIELGQTTLEEVNNIFSHLGLQLNHTTTRDNKEFYGVVYHLGTELEVTPILTVQNNIVESVDVGINDTSQEGTPRKWSAYSPETLIKRYGSPSRVEFFLGRVAPTPTHSMEMYFEQVNLIVQYIGSNLLNVDLPKLEMCPLTNQVEYIHIWMGDEPRYPPSPDVPLESATSLTLEEFSELMMGDPNKACFNLREEVFP